MKITLRHALCLVPQLLLTVGCGADVAEHDEVGAQTSALTAAQVDAQIYFTAVSSAVVLDKDTGASQIIGTGIVQNNASGTTTQPGPITLNFNTKVNYQYPQDSFNAYQLLQMAYALETHPQPTLNSQVEVESSYTVLPTKSAPNVYSVVGSMSDVSLSQVDFPTGPSANEILAAASNKTLTLGYADSIDFSYGGDGVAAADTIRTSASSGFASLSFTIDPTKGGYTSQHAVQTCLFAMYNNTLAHAYTSNVQLALAANVSFTNFPSGTLTSVPVSSFDFASLDLAPANAVAITACN